MLAERLRVSQPVVSDYENDMTRILAAVILEMGEIFNASTEEILGLKADIFHHGAIKNRRLLRRVQSIDKLSKRDQASVAAHHRLLFVKGLNQHQ